MDEITSLRAVRKTMSMRLFVFSIASILMGLLIYWIPTAPDWQKFLAAVASQFVIWGAIDLAFAIPGVLGGNKVKTDAQELADREKLIRVLRFNRKLNWLWVSTGAGLLGIGLAFSIQHVLVGHGIGVLVQGGFLFFFDRAFLRMVELTQKPTSSSLIPNQ